MTLIATHKGNELYKDIADQLKAVLTPDLKQDAKAQQLLELLNDFIVRMNDITPLENGNS